MHHSSLENMQKCYDRYIKMRDWSGKTEISVIDIGGANVNGNYSDIFSEFPFKYISVDIDPSSDVDVVLEDPYQLPFKSDSIDIIISGQVFEHVEFFWLLFEEMVRVLKPDGLIILIAPSSGPIHQYPVDCYRFYPDSFRALSKYTNTKLIYLHHDNRGPWKDLVGIFSKKNFENKDFQFPQSWRLNRFESEIHPANDPTPSTNVEHEKIQGKIIYTEFLRELHALIKPKLYLEIGVRTGKTFSLAHGNAIGIDPDPEICLSAPESNPIFKLTSDDFFDLKAKSIIQNKKIDLAFIDGMHLFEFVLRDFINIERYSHPKTIVVIDDIFPNHRIQANRKRQSNVWAGDVWKIFYCLKTFRKDLGLMLIDTAPTGLLLISGLKSKNNTLIENYNGIVKQYKQLEIDEDIGKDLFERKNATPPSDQLYKNIYKFYTS